MSGFRTALRRGWPVFAVALWLTLALSVTGASAATTPAPGTSVIGNQAGCLTPAAAAFRAPVVLGQCKPNGGSYVWTVLADGKIRLTGTRYYLGVSEAGILLRSARNAPVWVYGPGHTLATDGKLWLTWYRGSGTDRPWVTTRVRPKRQVWFEFTKV